MLEHTGPSRVPSGAQAENSRRIASVCSPSPGVRAPSRRGAAAISTPMKLPPGTSSGMRRSAGCRVRSATVEMFDGGQQRSWPCRVSTPRGAGHCANGSPMIPPSSARGARLRAETCLRSADHHRSGALEDPGAEASSAGRVLTGDHDLLLVAAAKRRRRDRSRCMREAGARRIASA